MLLRDGFAGHSADLCLGRALAQQALAGRPERPLPFVLTVLPLESVGAGERLEIHPAHRDAGQAAAAGLTRTLAQEWPASCVRVVAIDGELGRSGPAALARCLRAELAAWEEARDRPYG